MKGTLFFALLMGLVSPAHAQQAAPAAASSEITTAPVPARILWTGVTNSAAPLTVGPANFAASYTELLDIQSNPQFARNKRLLESTNKISDALRERLLKSTAQEYVTNVMRVTNLTFQAFDPRSLNHVAWTNLLARTNGRSTQVWSKRVHPPGWPSSKVAAEWNRNSLIYGMKGFTGLSPCWEGEGENGQVPITALTRRHGYTRGHGMGPEGFRKIFAGKKVWFVTPENKLVQVRIEREIVRAAPGRDYAIVIFDDDLPASIQPLRVMRPEAFATTITNVPNAPTATLFMEQGGNCTPLLPGFGLNVYKGGDSGSANLLPMPDELVFVSGRSTSQPDARMQADMDELCRLEKLDPAKYQLNWFDTSRFPSFAGGAAANQSNR